jgi:hypothetical protein
MQCSCNQKNERYLVMALLNLVKSKSDMNFRGPLIEGFGGDFTGTFPLFTSPINRTHPHSEKLMNTVIHRQMLH